MMSDKRKEWALWKINDLFGRKLTEQEINILPKGEKELLGAIIGDSVTRNSAFYTWSRNKNKKEKQNGKK